MTVFSRLTLLLLLVSPSFLQAELIDRVFPGKSEPELVAEFEEELGRMLADSLEYRNNTPPRMKLMNGKREIFAQMTKIDGSKTTWRELCKGGWFADKQEYYWVFLEPAVEVVLDELPAAELAFWLPADRMGTNERVASAAWLAFRGELTRANEILVPLVEGDEELRADIEAWLCAKNAWVHGGEKLEVVDVHLLWRNRDVKLLLTESAVKEHMERLSDEAKDALKELEKMRGDDKGAFSARRKRPAERLDILHEVASRFNKAYEGTKFLEASRNRKAVESLLKGIEADQKAIVKWSEKAEEFEAAKDKAQAAQTWEQLCAADPYDHELLQKAARCWYDAAWEFDGEKMAWNKEKLRKSAGWYEELTQQFPLVVVFHYGAGVARGNAGDTKQARGHFQRVVELTENRQDLPDAEAEYRQNALEWLKKNK